MIVRDNGHGGVQVTLNGHVTSVSGVQQIILNSKGGSDTFDYTLTSPLTTSEQLKLNLGYGNDQVKLDFTKGVTAPSLGINLSGGGGGDRTMEADFGAITNTDLTLAAQLGTEWDHFSTSFNGAVTGHAKVGVNVKGGAGYENVNVNVNANIAAQAQMSVVADLGKQEGTAHVNYKGQAGRRAVGRVAGRFFLELAGIALQPHAGQHRLAAGPRVGRPVFRPADPDDQQRGQPPEEPGRADQRRGRPEHG